MITNKDETHYLHIEPDPSGNSYFGNPYARGYENFVLEHLNRHSQEAGEIESVVILGYN
jgi:hypothetical protein